MLYGEGVEAMDRLTRAVLRLARRRQEQYRLTDAAVQLALERARYAETHKNGKPSIMQFSHDNLGTMPSAEALSE